MKKLIVISSIFVLIILTGVAGFFGYKQFNKNKTQNSLSTQEQNSKTTEPEPQKANKRPGSYEQYDESKLTLATDGKVVLFFNAKWSKTSKSLDKEFKDNADKLPDNFTILSVDYDKNYALRQKYHVPFENTFVQVDANGEVVNSWSGSEDMAEVVALAK